MDHSQKRSLRRLERLPDSRLPRRCKICRKSFMHPDVYTAHLTLHKVVKPIQKARLYVCRICTSKHRGLSAFLEHQKTHIGRVVAASSSNQRVVVSEGNDVAEEIVINSTDPSFGIVHRSDAAASRYGSSLVTSMPVLGAVPVSRDGIHHLVQQYASALVVDNSNLSNVPSNLSVSSAMSLVAALCSVSNPSQSHVHHQRQSHVNPAPLFGAPSKPSSSEGIQIEIPTQVKTIHLNSATPSLADVMKLISLLSNKVDALIKHFQVPIDEDGNLVPLVTASIEIENPGSAHKERNESQPENSSVLVESFPSSYSIIQAAKEQQQQEYYAYALAQQGSGNNSHRLEVADDHAEAKLQSKSKVSGKAIDLWITANSQYFSQLPVVGESNCADSFEEQNYVIPQSVVEKVFLESRSRGNFAKNLLFAICSVDERRGKNCSGRVYGKATPKGRLDQDKLNAVKELTMRKYPCHPSLVEITWKKECVTAIDSGLRNENRLSRTSEHSQDSLSEHHLQSINSIESDSSKMQDLPVVDMVN